MTFNPLDHSICLEMPIWLEESAWAGHVPFAMYLISAFKPGVFVELGVDRGTSYSAFCQAVKELQLNTKCFGIDTWRGDEHAGSRTDAVLERLRKHHDPLYGGFSSLVQSTFDGALSRFDDGSVDLLHIDGFHSYDAVRHDFETWRPKMSNRGIVLFHDSAVSEGEFGVKKYWNEVTRDMPSFEFFHSHGLGVLGVGQDLDPEMQLLFEARADEAAKIRLFFEQVGNRIEAVSRYERQLEYISRLQSYEKTVNGSAVMRAYRILRYEGIGSLIGKAIKRR